MSAKITVDSSKGFIEIEGSEEFVRTYDELVARVRKDFSEKQELLKASPSMPASATTEKPIQATDSMTAVVPPPPVAQNTNQLTAEGLRSFLAPTSIGDSAIESVTAFAYYLTEKLGWENVGEDDLEKCFRLIGKPVPALRNAVNNAAHRYNWLSRSRGSGIVVTREGKNHVEHGEAARGLKTGKGSATDTNGESRKKTSPSAPIPKVKGDLDLFGTAGHIAFKEFCESKGITEKSSNAEKFAACAYYLTQHVSQPTFDEHDVYTCFDHMRWSPPAYIRNNLVNHKNQFGYYTMDEGKFAVTLKLKIFVERELVKGKAAELNLSESQ